MRADDGAFYVVKFQNNPQDVRVLANEFFVSRIGSYLGLPVPEVAVIEVCDWLVKHTPELRITTAGHETPCSSGLQLGSRYVDDSENTLVCDYLPESIMRKNPWLFQSFIHALVLDKWTGNADGRQAVFTKPAYSPHFSVRLIDQGYCFNAGEWSFPDYALTGVYYRNFVYEQVTGWDSFEPALSRAEQMTGRDLWKLAHGMPDEWWSRNSSEPIKWSARPTREQWWMRQHTDLGRLIDTLIQRRSKIRDLITDFRNSTRNPFPNWVGN
jgi:hypothetical protein